MRKPFEPPPSYVLEIDGQRVGPTFGYGDEEDAHYWMATHHPGCPYTVITIDGNDRRVDYLPRQRRPKGL